MSWNNSHLLNSVAKNNTFVEFFEKNGLYNSVMSGFLGTKCVLSLKAVKKHFCDFGP